MVNVRTAVGDLVARKLAHRRHGESLRRNSIMIYAALEVASKPNPRAHLATFTRMS
jgi:hypothetical protein